MAFFIRIFILLVVGYILYRYLWKGDRFSFQKKSKKGQAHPRAALQEMKKDPVCGVYLPKDQAVTYRARGETYYFCSEECKVKFQEKNK